MKLVNLYLSQLFIFDLLQTGFGLQIYPFVSFPRIIAYKDSQMSVLDATGFKIITKYIQQQSFQYSITYSAVQLLQQYILTKQTFEMKALIRMFSSNPYTPTPELVCQYLSEVKLQSLEELPPQYPSLMCVLLQKCEKTHQFLQELLAKLKQAKSHSSILKLLTIIHTFVIERNYNRDDCRALQELQIGDILFDGTQQKWFAQLYRSYVTYLIKLPSLADVYGNIANKQFDVQPILHLTHIFRITNTVRVLFPSVTNAVNVIGRYQASKHAAMKQLFVVLSGQLVKLYSYIKYLCDQIQRQYRVYNPKDLQCFLQILPQLQLLCDKIEDLLVNKYLKGKKINVKIEFKEERVAQLQYYLQYEYTGRTTDGSNNLNNLITVKVDK